MPSQSIVHNNRFFFFIFTNSPHYFSTYVIHHCWMATGLKHIEPCASSISSLMMVFIFGLPSRKCTWDNWAMIASLTEFGSYLEVISLFVTTIVALSSNEAFSYKLVVAVVAPSKFSVLLHLPEITLELNSLIYVLESGLVTNTVTSTLWNFSTRSILHITNEYYGIL